MSAPPKTFAVAPTLVLVTTTAIQTIISIGTLALPAIAPQVGKALGVQPVLIGVQVSILYAAACAMSLLAGRSVDRFGAARTSQVALWMLAVGLVLCAIPSLFAIALGSAVMGAAYGLPNPAAAHLLHRFTAAQHRNLVFSLKQTGVPLGGGIAGLLAPRLTEAFDWRAPLLLVAAAAVLLGLALALVRPHWDDDRRPNAPLSRALREPIETVLRIKALRALLGVGFLLGGIQLCVIAYAVVLLVSDFGFTPIAAGSILALVQLGGIVGRIGWGILADRVGSSRAVLIVIAGAIAVFALSLRFVDAQLSVPILIGLGITAIGWNGVFLAEVARLAPDRRVGDATAVVLAGTYLGVFAGPAAFAALMPLIGSYAGAFMLLAISALAAVVLLALSSKKAANES